MATNHQHAMQSTTTARALAEHPQPSAVVEVDNASIGYWIGSEFQQVVESVSFDVRRGERVVLLGPSGCGKSTLLKAIGGFVPLLDGRISFDGRESPAPGPDRAVVFQEFDQLYSWKTVLNNVVYPLRVVGRKKSDALLTAQRYLKMMGLEHASSRYPHQLSGGMKQRVAIARAIALDPLMLLMDEPFGSLDAQTRERLQRELRDIAEQTRVTILLVTHSIDEAILIGHRTVVLGGTPSRVNKIVDTRDAGPPESAAFVALGKELRTLLGDATAV